MDGEDLKFTPSIDRRLFGTVEQSWLIVATFPGQILPNNVVWGGFYHLPPHPPHPIPPRPATRPPPYKLLSEISAHL